MQIYTAAMIIRHDQMARTFLYARVSTAEQTIAHQRTQAEAAGFVIDDIIEDEGVSGVQVALAERKGSKRLFDLLRDRDVLVCRWIDRLGRNYDDIQKNIRLFLDRGVTVIPPFLTGCGCRTYAAIFSF